MDSDLILRIYDAALDTDLWPDVLAEVAHNVGASGAIIFECDDNVNDDQISITTYSNRYDPAVINQYLNTFREYEYKDQVTFAAHSKSDDEIQLLSDAILEDDREDLLNLPHVQALLKMGIGYRYATLLNKDDFSFGRFSFQQSKKKKPLTAEQINYSNTLLPHIAKALSISRPLLSGKKQLQMLEATLSAMPIGAAIVTNTGILTYKNDEFLRQMQDYNIFYVDRDHKVQFREEQYQSLLHQLMGGVDKHGNYGARPRKEAIVTSQNNSDLSLCIEICPLSKILPFGEKVFPGFLIYSLDTRRIRIQNFEKISSMYKITPAETKTLKLLAKGMTNGQIAEHISRSVETVNSHVKSLYSKTYCHNRTQLVRMISGFGFESTPR